jgi:hypothetical protein
MTGKDDRQDGCSGEQAKEACAACRCEDLFPYWCQTCNRSVSAGRCPYCGLKAKKKKGETGNRSNKN